MIFTNPWGLLALFSIPLILGLHFFRNRRETRRIGGLHLWQFAEIRLPVGRRFDRLTRNLPLLFQLLAAFILSMLLSGLDVPHQNTRRHFTLALDNSVSMQSQKNSTASSAADRARQLLATVGNDADMFTVIAAGLRPEIIAGPFASKKDMLAHLKEWAPESSACDVDAALGLAGKFLTSGQKLLFVTDSTDVTTGTAYTVETAALGELLPNVAIEFADRARIASDRDRVSVTLRSYSTESRKVHLTATAQGGAALFEKDAELAPDKPASFSFETEAINALLTLSLDADALAADNVAHLAPVPIKVVHVYLMGLDAIDSQFQRAIKALPYTETTDMLSKAELVFSTVKTPAASGANTLYCHLPSSDELATSNSLTLVQGSEIILDDANTLVSNLPLEGVLWPCISGKRKPLVQDPIVARTSSLLWRDRKEGAATHYQLNLAWDRTNIYRTPAWPILLQGLVEECRRAMPGMNRVNFRAGESVVPRLPENLPALELKRDGKKFAAYEKPPETIDRLPAGVYELVQPDNKVVERFCVNLSSASESDLRGQNAKKPDLSAIDPASLNKTETNQAVYYALLCILLIMATLSWIYQDTSR